MLADDVRQIWNEAHTHILAECGANKHKLDMAELLGLRMLAQDALDQRNSGKYVPSKKQKPFTR